MNIVEINKKEYETYKDFYKDIYIKLDGKNNIDFEGMEDLHYNADMLNEFVWYNHWKNLHFIFKNFELDRIRNYKNYDNYQWSLIIEIFEDFVNESQRRKNA